VKLPVGVSGVVNAMEQAGWIYTITHGTGTVDAQAFGPPRGDGTRPKLAVHAPCESIAVRARHPGTGRQLRALWVCRTDKTKRAWTMSTAWRGRHDGEHTPRELSATAVKAYVLDRGDED
jgi:hypothetical protein